MSKIVKHYLAGLCLLVLGATAHAGLIVDTGPGTLSASGNAFGSAQWLAAEFVLDRPYYITRLEGWMSAETLLDDLRGQTFSISIWGDGGDVPAFDAASRLYTNGAEIVGADVANWEGYNITYGNGLELAQGTYWIVFEYRTPNGNTYANGAMPGNSPTPLLNEAYLDNPTTWAADDDLNLGIRIYGNPIPAPLPIATMAIGLLAIGWRHSIASKRQ